MSGSVSPVRQPAAMMPFATVEAFRPRVNNFYLMFLIMPPHIRDIFRFRPAFHRFAEQHPERVAELEEILEETGRIPTDRSWSRLLEAYQLMSVLADMSDPDVIPPPHLCYPEIDPATGVDPLYLTR